MIAATERRNYEKALIPRLRMPPVDSAFVTRRRDCAKRAGRHEKSLIFVPQIGHERSLTEYTKLRPLYGRRAAHKVASGQAYHGGRTPGRPRPA